MPGEHYHGCAAALVKITRSNGTVMRFQQMNTEGESRKNFHWESAHIVRN